MVEAEEAKMKQKVENAKGKAKAPGAVRSREAIKKVNNSDSAP